MKKKYCLTKVSQPWANGQVERMNERIVNFLLHGIKNILVFCRIA